MGGRLEQTSADLCSGLAARRPEIEQAVLTRVRAVSDPIVTLPAPEYLEGLNTAISAAVGYGLTVAERGEERAPAPPPVLLAQARMAARNGVGLETVWRLYFAGYALLGDFLVEEADRAALPGTALRRLLRAQAALFDRLLAAIGEEHSREARNGLRTSEQRRAERIERLLAGELLDVSELAYDFEARHLAAIAKGPGAAEALRDLAAELDCRLLAVRRGGGTHWAWLGSRREVDPEKLERALAAWPERASLAIGEPGDGLPGWRLSHRQAKAVLPIAQRGADNVVRYAEAALLASILQDDLLVASLRRFYLEPLEGERDGGETLRETLRAYFEAGRNVSSSAAALGVSRQAVAKRLHGVEERLGRPLGDCGAELEAALHLASIDVVAASPEIDN